LLSLTGDPALADERVRAGIGAGIRRSAMMRVGEPRPLDETHGQVQASLGGRVVGSWSVVTSGGWGGTWSATDEVLIPNRLEQRSWFLRTGIGHSWRPREDLDLEVASGFEYSEGTSELREGAGTFEGPRSIGRGGFVSAEARRNLLGASYGYLTASLSVRRADATDDVTGARTSWIDFPSQIAMGVGIAYP
jgi:hypothetical protein